MGDEKFLKYRAKILAVNMGDQPDRLTQNITVPTFRGYQAGDVIPAGTLLRDIINKEFNSTPPTPKVTIIVTGDGTTDPAAGAHDVSYGADFTIYSATPGSGKRLKSATFDGNDITLPYTERNVVADHTIRVEFEEIPIVNYTITASAGANGSITPSGAVSVTEGGSQAFTIAPASGYQIKDVKVDGASVGNVSSYTFSNVTADHTIAAEFEEIPAVTHTIVASAGTGGTISPSGNVTVGDGGSQTFRFEADPNYNIDDVLVDGVSQGFITTYTFSNVTADHTISVSFSYNPPTIVHNIVASAGANGSITPNGTVHVDEGNSQSFTIAPASGYVVDDVLVDGVSVGAVTSYTFSNVVADHTIAASFKVAPVEQYHVVIADATDSSLSGYGTISPAVGTHDVAVGSSQAVVATPASGFKIKSFKVDSTEQAISDPTQAFTYTVSGIAADATVNIIVEFEQISSKKVYIGHIVGARNATVVPTSDNITLVTTEEKTDAELQTLKTSGWTVTHPARATFSEYFVAFPAEMGNVASVTDMTAMLPDNFANAAVTIEGNPCIVCYKPGCTKSGTNPLKYEW